MSFGRSVRVLSVALSLRVQACHRDRLRGDIDAAINCNDPWTWQASGYAKGHEGLLHDLDRYAAESAEGTSTISSPDQIGHTSCAAPCDAIAIASFADVGSCLACHNQPIALDLWADTLGTPPVTGDGDAIDCQGVIGRAVVRYLSKRFKLQHGCEFKHEVGKDDYENYQCANISAVGHPLERRITRFRARMVSSIERGCAEVDIATLIDSCAADAAGIGECVVAGVEQWTAAMHAQIYPPLPPP